MGGGTGINTADSTFENDPLAWLDGTLAQGLGVRWTGADQLCVLDAEVARSLLKDEHGLTVQHSDFFGPPENALAPRPAQIALARECHGLVQRHVRRVDWLARVDAIGESSVWPDAGNRLMLELMRPVLASPRRSAGIHKALDTILESRIANRHGPPRRQPFKLFQRFRLARAILAEANASRPSGDPEDVLDIISSARGGMNEAGLVHLYLALVFALAGSIGFTVGWALLLGVRHNRTGCPAPYLVREALRLYPVAWLLGRTPVREFEVMGERVSPAHVIAISPYAVHRSAAYWPEPSAFKPERWQGKTDRKAWLPFGAGSQSCVAASLSVEVASATLGALLKRPLAVAGGDGPPSVRAALAPPAFKLLRHA